MEAFRLRIMPSGEIEVVQASRVPMIGEEVIDGLGQAHTVTAVQWGGDCEPQNIRILLPYVVAR